MGASKKPKKPKIKKAASKNERRKRRLITAWAAALAFVAVTGISFIWSAQIDKALGLIVPGARAGEPLDKVLEFDAGAGKTLAVHFIDVGQGDACVIELPDGKKILIDGGKDKEKSKLLGYIDAVIDDGADSMRDAEFGFDYAILTHADEDHCGGFDDVLDGYGAEVFYRPNEEATYKDYADPGKNNLLPGYTAQDTLAYMRAVDAGHNNSGSVRVSSASDAAGGVIKPDGIQKGGSGYYELVFYTPVKNSYKNHNDYSPIMILYFAGRSIALSGDAETAAEKEFTDAAAAKDGDKYAVFDERFNADVIKLGHHGSRTSSGGDYLAALTAPDSVSGVFTVISCGAGNTYDHPHPETLDRLSGAGFAADKVLRTDIYGSIVFRIDSAAAGAGTLTFAVTAESERAAIRFGETTVGWRGLCVSAWILLALILLIRPLASVLRKNFKRNSSKRNKKSAG
ncbi:MAG: MBL fold metallo-hydrolase [Clostridiales bacterium]|jgi:beta-lactamase superfamily II metal-dependent hydrolase|nr:MBL fold metallo-hydrolase [Clostridiales bacterium]